MHNEIEFITTKEIKATILIKEQFEYRNDKKYHNLQKILFWILSKIECYAKNELITYEHHTIAIDNFMENMFSQNRELMSIYNKHGKYLLIGPKEYHDLTGNKEITSMFRFNAEYHNGDGEINGMNVQVIPWMKGMLVVPELNI